jgi:AraC family transcriptional regulator
MTNRDSTIRDHQQRIARVLTYIQDNIGAPLLLEDLAAVANFSPFHFHRIFTAHTGETLSGYIRRVRLDRAANQLLVSREPVTAVALNAGYETPAAFTKAFKQHFGQPPAEFRQARRLDACPPPLVMLPPIPKETAMKPEIRTLTGQTVLFVRRTGNYATAASAAWSALMPIAYSQRLMSADTRSIGIGYDNPAITPEDKIRYDACITVPDTVKPTGEAGIQTIAGGRYAVFLHKGPYEGLAKTYRAIMGDWYPASGARLRDLPCFEVYLNRDPRKTKPENLRTEIYVPTD